MCRSQELGVYESNPRSHQSVAFDEKQEFNKSYIRSQRQSLKKREELVSVFDVTARQFTDYRRMADHLCIQEQFLKMSAALAKVSDPDGSTNDDHG